MYASFTDLKKPYYRVNKEALLRIYDVGGKLLSGIRSMYVKSSAYVRIKGGESERFRINSLVRQGCIMSPWLFSVYMDGAVKEVKMGMGRRGVSFMEDGREWRLLGLLYMAVRQCYGGRRRDLE